MSRRWVLIDDQENHGHDFASLLTIPDELEIQWATPNKDPGFLRKVIEKEQATGVLLDYALNEADASVTYGGATLAGFLRAEFPDLPVVVLSAKLNDGLERRRFDRTRELFDWELDKHDVTIETEFAQKALVTLTDGYERLNDNLTGAQNPRVGVAVVLDLPKNLDPSSDRAEVCGLAADLGSGEAFQTARFIIHTLLELPGPLLSPERAAVALGFEPGSAGEFEKLLATARYTGVFAGIFGHDHYWREGLAGINPPDDFGNHAHCVVCGERAYEICEVCKGPVDGLHSLPVHRREAAPEIFLRGRVCGFCLDGDEELQQENLAVDSAYADMVDGIVREAKGLERESE